jgi:hypothetical protein
LAWAFRLFGLAGSQPAAGLSTLGGTRRPFARKCPLYQVVRKANLQVALLGRQFPSVFVKNKTFLKTDPYVRAMPAPKNFQKVTHDM